MMVIAKEDRVSQRSNPASSTSSMKYRISKFKNEPRLPKEPELPSDFFTKDTVRMQVPSVKYEVVVMSRETGRESKYYFRGKGAMQSAFDLANRHIFKFGNSVLINRQYIFAG